MSLLAIVSTFPLIWAQIDQPADLGFWLHLPWTIVLFREMRERLSFCSIGPSSYLPSWGSPFGYLVPPLFFFQIFFVLPSSPLG